MPLDLRRSYFSEGEIIDAITEYCRQRGVRLPPTRVQSLRIAWKPHLAVTLKFAPNLTEQVEELTFDTNEVAAALILYCHRFHEPLPHHSEKGLEPCEGGIQLLMRFPWGDDWNDKHPAFHKTFPAFNGGEEA
ncbi:MAG: hypothetical protein HQL35_12925 [Alphaproteobacteria bacterium]|nr:hypothetical protein [Alphaproteobacteria bacterium]